MALAGFAAGIRHRGKIHIDIRQNLFSESIKDLGFEEKQQMHPEKWTLGRIEGIIDEWQAPAIYAKRFPKRASLDRKKRHVMNITHRKLHGGGSIDSMRVFVQVYYKLLQSINIFGKFLVRVGRWIQTITPST